MQISLYNTIDEELLNLAGYERIAPTITYHDLLDTTEQVIDFPNSGTQIIINETDNSWSPIEHNLIVEQHISLKNPSVFFGNNGVTNASNTLGIACQIYSKTSHFQKTIQFAEITSDMDQFNESFLYEFEPDTIGGSVFMNFYIYLKEIKVTDPIHANTVGTNLMNDFLQNISIIIDGNGSEFPIMEINDPTQPLWRVEMTWTDLNEDLFNTNSVRLILNQGHELFNQLMNQRPRINQYLMNDIIISAMTSVIQQAILIDGNEFRSEEDYQPGSIAQVIWYWISTYEINTESLDSIANSIRKNADPFIEGGSR